MLTENSAGSATAVGQISEIDRLGPKGGRAFAARHALNGQRSARDREAVLPFFSAKAAGALTVTMLSNIL
jgi:hypothetical protein